MGVRQGMTALTNGDLERRVARKLIGLHVAQLPDRVLCLDINREFTSMKEFDANIHATIGALPGNEVAPGAPAKLWEQFASNSFQTLKFYFHQSGRMVTVRKGEFK